MGKCGTLLQYRGKHSITKNNILRCKTCTILTCMVSIWQLQNANEINFWKELNKWRFDFWKNQDSDDVNSPLTDL